MLVIGAGNDYIVDRQGVEETARFLGTKAVFIEGVSHDLMLGAGWEKSAEVIDSWMLDNGL